MKYWLEKATEFVPNLEDLITSEQALPGPMGLWIELHFQVIKAYDESPSNKKRIRGIYDFAAWCFAQPQTFDASTDLSTAVAVAFIEHLPLDRKVSEHLHRWMSMESFEGFENLFRCHLSDEEYRQFAKHFRSRRRLSDPLPRF